MAGAQQLEVEPVVRAQTPVRRGEVQHDDRDGPPQVAHDGEPDERHSGERLVGDRVGDLAEVRDQVAAACEVAVDLVGDHRADEDRVRDQPPDHRVAAVVQQRQRALVTALLQQQAPIAGARQAAVAGAERFFHQHDVEPPLELPAARADHADVLEAICPGGPA